MRKIGISSDIFISYQFFGDLQIISIGISLFESGIIFSKQGWEKRQSYFILLEFVGAIFIKMEKTIQL